MRIIPANLSRMVLAMRKQSVRSGPEDAAADASRRADAVIAARKVRLYRFAEKE